MSSLFSQTRLGLNIGIGIPEAINAGFKAQHKQAEAGLFFGTFPISHQLYTVGGHVMWHLLGESRHLTARPWYLKADLIYYREENKFYIWEYWYSGLRCGREFALNESLSVQLDLGFCALLKGEKIAKQPNSSGWNIDFPVLPAGSVSVFYSF